MVLSFVCLLNNGKICCGQLLFPTEFAEKPPSFGSPSYPAILHMYKELYNQPLTEWETHAFQPPVAAALPPTVVAEGKQEDDVD